MGNTPHLWKKLIELMKKEEILGIKSFQITNKKAGMLVRKFRPNKYDMKITFGEMEEQGLIKKEGKQKRSFNI